MKRYSPQEKAAHDRAHRTAKVRVDELASSLAQAEDEHGQNRAESKQRLVEAVSGL